jgi:MoxR-like ATPase
MTLEMQATNVNMVARSLIDAVGSFIEGKPEAVELAVITLLAEGHLLLEDVPGVGKTSLALSLAHAIGVPWSRVQFTPDLLPSDVTGAAVFHQGTSTFEFHPGPVFASIVLADEINRSSPRTQSALLEAMQERAVTVDGHTHPLPRPFMVIATQNPIEMSGTYPLPEAQLDRFLMRISLGYPARSAEIRILAAQASGATIDRVAQVVSPEQFESLLHEVSLVTIEPELLDYIVSISEATRIAPSIELGVSPRGSVAMMRAARAYALVHGRDFVMPGDIQALAAPVLAHRIVLEPGAQARGQSPEAVIRSIIETTPAPQP